MALHLEEWRLKMTDGVTAVLDKIKGGADGAAAKFTKVQDQIGGASGNMKLFASQSNGAVKGVGKGVEDEILAKFQNQLPAPINNVVGLLGGLAGPITIAAGLVGGLAVALNKAVDSAAAFGVPFRELRNLNLDKSKAEIQDLNDRLVKLSFEEGLDPQKLVRGVFDIQSATGKYGTEVEQMVAKVGVASRALNIDFNQAVGAAGKALVAFKLPLEDVDKLLESNAKTVQVGIVTFDELARVQTEYAGAAASGNQQLDTANKVFAVLSKSAKSADIAATQAKMAFQDLGKQSTIDGFKKIGVSVYDANGNMRQADQILKDLVPKFQSMSDQTFGQLKEEIGGSEGLRALLDQAKASGDEMLRTLNDFDSTGFNINTAIKEASGDLDVMNDKMSNQMTASWVELGQAVMPTWISIKSLVNDIILGVISLLHRVGDVVRWFKDLYAQSALVRYGIQQIVFTFKTAWELVVAAFKVSLNTILTPIKAIGQALTGNFKGAFTTLMEGGDKTVATLKDSAKNIGHAFNTSLGEVVNGGAPVDVAVAPVMDKDAYGKLFGAAATPFGKAAPASATLGTDPYAKLFGKGGKGKGETSTGLGGVAGGGGQVRNVTINITKLVERIEVHTAGTLKDGMQNIQAQVEEAIVNMVRGSEATLANG